MHERLKNPIAKRLKVQRSATVEPVLGTLINFTGMRRIWTRGIGNANKFVLGAAIAYNLKKWLKWSDTNISSTKSKKGCGQNKLNKRILSDINTFKTLSGVSLK